MIQEIKKAHSKLSMKAKTSGRNLSNLRSNGSTSPTKPKRANPEELKKVTVDMLEKFALELQNKETKH